VPQPPKPRPGTGARVRVLADPIRVLLADDDAGFRSALRRQLEQEGDITVVSEADSPDAAAEACGSVRPHVMLLEVAMGGGRGVELLERLRPLALGVRVLLLTGAMSRPELLRALQLGAYGLVLKTTPAAMLVKSIRRVHAGEFWVGRDMVADLVRALAASDAANPAAPVLRAPRAFALTPRELQIVGGVAAGFTNRQMAEKFGLAEDTVKHYLTSIFDKTGVANRLELALFAIHHRLTQSAPER
jgi:two-component system nitrate/nitrite response regulator NarL